MFVSRWKANILRWKEDARHMDEYRQTKKSPTCGVTQTLIQKSMTKRTNILNRSRGSYVFNRSRVSTAWAAIVWLEPLEDAHLAEGVVTSLETLQKIYKKRKNEWLDDAPEQMSRDSMRWESYISQKMWLCFWKNAQNTTAKISWHRKFKKYDVQVCDSTAWKIRLHKNFRS